MLVRKKGNSITMINFQLQIFTAPGFGDRCCWDEHIKIKPTSLSSEVGEFCWHLIDVHGIKNGYDVNI